MHLATNTGHPRYNHDTACCMVIVPSDACLDPTMRCAYSEYAYREDRSCELGGARTFPPISLITHHAIIRPHAPYTPSHGIPHRTVYARPAMPRYTSPAYTLLGYAQSTRSEAPLSSSKHFAVHSSAIFPSILGQHSIPAILARPYIRPSLTLPPAIEFLGCGSRGARSGYSFSLLRY
jgi:hypothetical protein